MYGGGGIGANRGSWEGWLDCGLLKGCGAERRWSIFEQARDRAVDARSFSTFEESGCDPQRRDMPRN